MARVTGLTAVKMMEIQDLANEAVTSAADSILITESARDTAVTAATNATNAIQMVQLSETNASTYADNALAAAERAESASGGIDMSAITDRLDSMDDSISSKATLVNGKIAYSEVPTSQSATQNTIPSRTTNGRLPGIGTPTATTDAATKAYVDQFVTAVDADLVDMENMMASKQDLMMTTTLNAFNGGANYANGAAECTIVAAPVAMEITAVVLTWDSAINISGSTNRCNIRIVHRANTAASAVNIVQLASVQQPIGGSTTASQRKAWNMKNGTWNTASNRIVPANNVISFVLGTYNGGMGNINFLLPMTVTIMWRPA